MFKKELKYKPLKMNLQHFAEPEDPKDPPADPPADPPGDERTPEQIEFDKKVEAESDRKLESAKKKWEKDHQEKIDKAVADAVAEKERLSNLSEKERKDEELNQREKALEKRLADIERKELLADAASDLSKKDLPVEFAELLLGEDAEKTLENINNFKAAFDKAVNDAVKEKLRQDTPLLGGGGISNTDNLGKQLAKLNKQNNTNAQAAQHNYFNDGGNK